MLILAGVSISAIVGEDGVLTKAKAASIASRKASILEELNLELASYNIDAILKSPEETITMLGNLISKGLNPKDVNVPELSNIVQNMHYLTFSSKTDNYETSAGIPIGFALYGGFIRITSNLSSSIGFVQKINSSKRYNRTAFVLKIVMGTAILLIGLYMFWLAF